MRFYKMIHDFFCHLSGINKQIDINSEWFGSSYGGFYLYELNLNENSIIYSFGLGEDITFDLAVIEKFRCKVFGFDPTPKSLAFLKTHQEKNLIIRSIGISKLEGSQTFYLPKNSNYVSGSLKKTKNLKSEINVLFDTFENIVQSNNHTSIDILKMDIEGTEFDIIPEIVCSKIPVKQLLIEFHPRFFWNGYYKLYKVVKLLRANGYKCYAISKSFNEVSFIKE